MIERELLQLSIARAIARRVPRRLRHRTARLLYDYTSPALKGVDIVVPYLEPDGLRLLVNSKEFIGWNILFHGEYEATTNAIMRRLVRPGHVVVEAGANNGSETVLFGSLVGPLGRVYAFEPVPHVAERLRVNLHLNGLKDVVTVEQAAIGARTGTVTLHLPPRDHPNQGMASKFLHDLAHDRMDVQQVSLDDWAEARAVTRLDFLKMDIQGMEIELLHGARRLLETHRPPILTEAVADCSDISELHAALEDLGYVIFLADKPELSRLSPRALAQGNWLAFHHRDERRPASE